MKKFAIIAATAALLTVTAASASHGYGEVYGDGDRGYHYGQDRDDRDDGYQASNAATEYAEVLEARPIYREVRVSQPRQECRDERVVYRDDYSDHGYDHTVGAVIGGVLGGAVGHQISRGSGRTVATVIGAVIGSQIGQSVQRDNADYRRESRERVAYEPHCRSVDDSRYEQRAEGYDVTYRYHDRIYHSNLPYDPGNRLAVTVNVAPAHY